MADRIRKINSQSRDVHAVITTSQLAAGAAITAITVTASGTVYAADRVNDVIYKVFEDGRVLGTVVGSIGLAGDVVSSGLYGSGGNSARINQPLGLAVDMSENIYISDSTNHKVKRMSPSGRCQTFVGTGVAGNVVGDNGLVCQLSTPTGVAVDRAGMVYICDYGNLRIKKAWPNGKVVTLAGSTSGMVNAQGNAARFAAPYELCVDRAGYVYVVDVTNHRVRKIDPDGNVITLAGLSAGFVDAVGNNARFSSPTDIAIDYNDVQMYVLDKGNNAIRKVLQDGTVTTFMEWKSGTTGNADAIDTDASGFIYTLEKNV